MIDCTDTGRERERKGVGKISERKDFIYPAEFFTGVDCKRQRRRQRGSGRVSYSHLGVCDIRFAIKVSGHVHLLASFFTSSKPLLAHIRMAPHRIHVLHIRPVIPEFHVGRHLLLLLLLSSHHPRLSPAEEQHRGGRGVLTGFANFERMFARRSEAWNWNRQEQGSDDWV